MKKILITCFIVLFTIGGFAQSNNALAKSYIKRANESLSGLQIDNSLKYFDTALTYMDSITDYKVARLGFGIHFELENWAEAKNYAQQYFNLATNTTSEEYETTLDLFITVDENLKAQVAEEQRIEQERIAKEKELARIDSLKTVWSGLSDAMLITADSIYDYNKQGTALYKKDGKFGIIDDVGNIVVEADKYEEALNYDDYILLLDKKDAPTNIYSYNITKKDGYRIPDISNYNMLSTNYGKVMLPRGSGRVVFYPNNSSKVIVYDLEAKKSIRVSNLKELLKDFKTNKLVKKTNKENQIRLDSKIWYNFGGNLGGGIYPLFEGTSLYGYLTSSGRVILAKDYKNVGGFYNGKLQVDNGNEQFWIGQDGRKQNAPTNEAGSYQGDSKIVKEDGKYQIHQMIDGQNTIILGDKKLTNMTEYLRSNK